MANRVLFPGINNILGARFTLSRGAAPSKGTLTILPQASLSLTPQTMTWESDFGTLQFPNCSLHVSHLRPRRIHGEWSWDITFYDRRLLWGKYNLDGDYNVRLENGTVTPATKKNARELATLILNGIGELGAIVDGMPTNVYPRCHWNGTNAAAALQWLCEYCSCAIGFDTGGRVQLLPYGQGSALPTAFRMNPSYQAIYTGAPSELQAVSGPVTYQSRLQLEAVAREESSETLQKMDEVEWKPSSGFEYESRIHLPNVDALDRHAGFETAWRWFRAIAQADGSMQVPGCNVTVSSLSQILPVHERLASLITDDDQSSPFGYMPLLRGDYWPQGDVLTGVEDEPWPGSFRVYRDRGLVETDVPIIAIDDAQHVVPPKLYLSAAYHVRDGQTGQLDRLIESRTIGGYGAKQVLVRPEVTGAYVQLYDDGNSPAEPQDTREAARAELKAYLDQFAQRYLAAALVYEVSELAGYHPCPLDGRIAQITLEYGFDDIPKMIVSTNYEHDTFNESFEESLRKFTLQRLEAV